MKTLGIFLPKCSMKYIFKNRLEAYNFLLEFFASIIKINYFNTKLYLIYILFNIQI